MIETKKDNKEKVKDLIKSITGEEAKVVAVPSELIHFIGDPSKAVLLSQLIYWSDRGSRNDGFIFKTYDEMYTETGIKKKTCHRYYQEFKKMGFLNWKIKKANGFPTIHFKLDMVKLTRLMETFWLQQKGQNDQNDTIIMSESLTENTNKDNSLPKSRETAIQSKDVKEKEQSTINDSSITLNSSEFNDSSELRSWDNIPVPMELAVPLPSNFQPSLENQFWAVTSFPYKSPELATKSFTNHLPFKKRTNTLMGWQIEWGKWMQKEDEPRGYDENKLLAEHRKIKNKVQNAVYKLVSETNRFLIHRESFYSILCQEEHDFSRETIDECLTFLESNAYLASYFGDYFYVNKIDKEGQWESVTDLSPIYDAWNRIDNSLEQYIINECLVLHTEILEKFGSKHKDSIEVYLQAGVGNKYLIENNGRYLSSYKYEDDENYRNRVNAKLKELGWHINLTEEGCEIDEKTNEWLQERYLELESQGYNVSLYAKVN